MHESWYAVKEKKNETNDIAHVTEKFWVFNDSFIRGNNKLPSVRIKVIDKLKLFI